MRTTLDYYLSLNSPWSYLGGARLATLAQRLATALGRAVWAGERDIADPDTRALVCR